jgi:hypothetical protein
LHCPAGPSQVDELLFPPPFCVVVVVVHPGLPAVQVLPLPPWLVVVVVVNPFLFPLVLSASAALEANANKSADANTSVEISFVMGLPPWTEFRRQSFAPAAPNSVSKTCANPQVIGLKRETNLRHSLDGKLRSHPWRCWTGRPGVEPPDGLNNFVLARRWDENVPGEGCNSPAGFPLRVASNVVTFHQTAERAPVLFCETGRTRNIATGFTKLFLNIGSFERFEGPRSGVAKIIARRFR